MVTVAVDTAKKLDAALPTSRRKRGRIPAGPLVGPEAAAGRQDRRIRLNRRFPRFTAEAPVRGSGTRQGGSILCLPGHVHPVLPRFLQEPFREREDIGIGNVFLVDRTEPASSSQAIDCVVVADGLDLTRLVHQRTVWMACRIVRGGGQHRTVEGAQSEMRDQRAQLEEYVETGLVEVSPEGTSAGGNCLRKRGWRRAGDACDLDAVQPAFDTDSGPSYAVHAGGQDE
jgi:hypothetical protein